MVKNIFKNSLYSQQKRGRTLVEKTETQIFIS